MMNRRDLLTGMLAGTAAATLPSSLIQRALAAPSSSPQILTVLKRTYRKDGQKISASFVNEVLVEFAITPD